MTNTAIPASKFALLNDKGWRSALEHTASEVMMKDGKKFPFGKSTVAVGGVAAMAHGLLADKTADGEDRSALMRLAEVVIGGGMVAGAALSGKGI